MHTKIKQTLLSYFQSSRVESVCIVGAMTSCFAFDKIIRRNFMAESSETRTQTSKNYSYICRFKYY